VATITDEYMRERLGQTRPYTLMVLKKTAAYRRPEHDAIVWEHGRRNFSLRADGDLAVVLPVTTDPSDLAGIGVFTGTPEEVALLMDADPGVVAGIFTYEIVSVRGFPGDGLPA
jgi:hypothetical protein